MCLFSHCELCKKNSINESWDYKNQEEWKTYQNYYSTIRTPININTSRVIDSCKHKFKINYNNNVDGILQRGLF